MHSTECGYTASEKSTRIQRVKEKERGPEHQCRGHSAIVLFRIVLQRIYHIFVAVTFILNIGFRYRLKIMFFELLVRFLAPLIDLVAVKFRPLAMVLVVMPLSYVLRKFLHMRERVATRNWPEGTTNHNERAKRVKVRLYRNFVSCSCVPCHYPSRLHAV